MRILFINTLSQKGSTGRICKQIADYLESKNIESAIACRYNDEKFKNNNVYEISSYLDCHIHNRIVRHTGLQGYFSYFKTLKFIKYIENYNPDIIHIHNIFGSYLNFKLFFKYLIKSKRKIIWTLHDCQAYTGYCPYYTDCGCNKWKSECKNCDIIRKDKQILIDFSNKIFKDKKKIYSKLENINIVTVSKWLEQECKESILKDKNICTIYNGIDTSTFYYDKQNLKDNELKDKFVILAVANIWDKRKGLDRFIELSKLLNENYQLILIGLTKEQLATLPKNIVGIEKTQSIDELRRYYNLADVFVNLSKEETFGLVVGEAMACGTPAIVYNSTACPELINDKTGLVLNTNSSVFDIKAAIDEIKNKGKQFYSQHAIQRIKEEFSVEKMQLKYFNLYKKECEKDEKNWDNNNDKQ